MSSFENDMAEVLEEQSVPPPTEPLAPRVWLDPHTRLVTVGAVPVLLSKCETAILEALLFHCSVALTREQLIDHAPGTFGHVSDPRIIDVHVCKLSRKLRQAGAPDLIKTVYGQGYMIAETLH